MKKDNKLEEEFIKNIGDNMPAEKLNDVMEMQQLFTIVQNRLYSKYNFDWDNMTIEEKTPPRWLKAQYMLAETFVTGRWKYWMDIRFLSEHDKEKAKKFIVEKDIPKIAFYPNHIAKSMLDKCIANPHLRSLYKSEVLSLFTDWLLYGFGDLSVTELPKQITSEANEYWYRNFRAQDLIMYPDDYLGAMAADLGLGKEQGYFPTPMHVVDLMTRITMCDKDKLELVNDPCMGSGRMLLTASNHSLRLTGQDINPNIVKIAKVNGYLYIPWLVESDENTDNIIKELLDEESDDEYGVV